MKILAANRLTDGEAVWLMDDHRWSETIHDACIARDKADEERLERAGEIAVLRNEVVDISLIDVAIVDGVIRPNRLREQIRAAGPTIHPELGKQSRKQPAGVA